jgi:hypothetical protein
VIPLLLKLCSILSFLVEHCQAMPGNVNQD